MKRTRLGNGQRSLERGSTFARERKALKRGDGLGRGKRLGRGRPRRRSDAERNAASEWHEAVRSTGPCVKCGGPAGRWGHHLVPKGWLRRRGLADAIWGRENVANGVPICDPCHEGETNHASRISRADLGPHWWAAVEWARRLDAGLPGEPVLSRLEREYPEASE